MPGVRPVFAAGEVVRLTFQRHKRQPELHCRGPNAESGVGAATGDGRGDGQMGKFLVRVAADVDGAEFFRFLSLRSAGT